MDYIKVIMPVIWQIIEKKKRCAVNISTVNDKLTVNILFGRRRKIFSHSDNNVLLSQLQGFLAA
jgi:hypothetical protein